MASGEEARPSAEPASQPAAPARHRPGRLARSGAIFVAAFALVLLCIGGAVGWAVGTPAGSAWLLDLVPGVHAQGVRGALLGDFAADRIEVDLDAGHLRLEQPAWTGAAIHRGPGATWLRLSFAELRAGRIEWRASTRPAAAPSPPPQDLGLPFALDVAALRVGEVRFGASDLDVLHDLEAEVHLGDDAGSVHRVDRLALEWGRMRLAGHARIGTRPPLAVEAQLQASQEAVQDLPAWQARVDASGPLAELRLQASVRATGTSGHPPQTLEARAGLQPFAPWPLGDLDLALADFDLSALHAALPATRLSGSAEARTRSADTPGRVDVHLANTAAGRWDAGRLPLRRLDAVLRARPDDLRSLELQAFDAELGTGGGGAGRLTGTGRWNAEGWALDAVLAAVDASALDARAPAWTLGGSIALRSDPKASGAVEVRGALDGRLAANGPLRAVHLRLDASVASARIEVRSARLEVAEATVSLQGRAVQTAKPSGWNVQGSVALARLDPALWAAAEGLRAGSSRLDADGRFDLAWPGTFPEGPWPEMLAAIRGHAELTLAPSVLAGVELRGAASWRHDDGRTALAKASIDAAGNRIDLQGRLDVGDREGHDDLWDLTIDAPALARVAPLWRVVSPTHAPAAAPDGVVTLEAHVQGRWPAISTRGRLEATRVRLDRAQLDSASARWELGTSARAPMSLDAHARGASLDGRTLESLELRVDGTAEAHGLTLRAVANALPPAWVETLQTAGSPPPAEVAARSVAIVRAHGSLAGAGPTGATGWRGVLEQLELRRDDERAAPWLHAAEIGLETQWAGGPMRLALQPGRLDLLGAGVRWTRFAWIESTPAAPMRLDVEATLDPVPIAPLLRAAQPDFGWGGDLSVGGTVTVRSEPRVHADVVVERHTGDLFVIDETGTQALGLTDLRLGLVAADGVWTFTQALAGRTLGAASGAIVARTPPAQTWPDAATPIEGVLELQVASLGEWGTWVPAGWRLGGALRVSARVGGRVAAPEVTGRIVGSGLSVRNYVQGVAIGDGEVAIALQGTSAHIERFSARAGTGSVDLEGDASLGAAPRARLRLVADRFELLGRVDRRIVASGRAELALDTQHVVLEGRFGVDEGLIDFSKGGAPKLGDDVQVVRRRDAPAPTTATSQSASARRTTVADPGRPDDANPPGTNGGAAAARNVALDLQVGMGEHLRIRGHGLDALLRGDLAITSPRGQLAVRGTVYTADGTYAAYGQNLVIDRGELVFAGPVDNPRLDVEATRPNLDVRVGVAVTGTALNPRVRLFSEPEMTEMDKISWLVLGRASEGLGNADTALLQHAALALLAGEGGGGPASFTRTLGLDELSVRQSEGDVKDTIVSFGKQLSKRWYVGYERGLNATTGSVQLAYRVAQRFTLRATAGGDNAIDLIWTWRWQ